MAKNKEKYKSCEDLYKHPFVELAYENAEPIIIKMFNTRVKGTNLKGKPAHNLIITKNERYTYNTFYVLNQFLEICEQLSYTILYLLSFCPSSRMKKEGVTKASHIKYCIENYIIRTQILYDRMLQLINIVFNIGNPSDCITHSLIKNNLHVKDSQLDSALQKLKKITNNFREEKNKIIHREEGYREDKLLYIGTLTLISQNKEYLKKPLKFESNRYVQQKSKEFSNTNSKIFLAVEDIFDHLLKEYRNQHLENAIGTLKKLNATK